MTEHKFVTCCTSCTLHGIEDSYFTSFQAYLIDLLLVVSFPSLTFMQILSPNFAFRTFDLLKMKFLGDEISKTILRIILKLNLLSNISPKLISSLSVSVKFFQIESKIKLIFQLFL